MASLADLKLKIKKSYDDFVQDKGFVGAMREGVKELGRGTWDFGTSLGQSAAAAWNAQRNAKEVERAIEESNKTLATAKRVREAGNAEAAAQLTRKQGTRLADLSARIHKETSSMPTEKEMTQKLVSGGLRTGLTIAGATAPGGSKFTVPLIKKAIKIPTLLTNAAVGGGLNVAMGDRNKSGWERFGEGAGSSVKYSGINRITGPYVDKATKAAGLIPRVVTKAGTNLAEDMAYARLAENRNITPSEAAFSVALPTVTEVGGEAVKKIRLSRQLANSHISKDGYVRNSEGRLYNPETYRYVPESSPEAQTAKLAQKKYIRFVGGGVMPEDKIGKIRLKKTGPNSWVDTRYTNEFKSDVVTPKLEVVDASGKKIKLNESGKIKIKKPAKVSGINDPVNELRNQIGDTFKVVESVGDLWKQKDNTIFIKPERDNPGFTSWLRTKNFVESADEAGNGIYRVKMKLSSPDQKMTKIVDPTLSANIAEQKNITRQINKGQEALRRGGWGSNKFSPEEMDMVQRGLDHNTARLKKSVMGNLPENSPEMKVKAQTLSQEYEQAQVDAEQASLMRSMFSDGGIRDIAQLKFLGSKILANGGDMESVRAKYPQLVERVTQAVREAEPTIEVDEEAFRYALDLPTKAATLASKPIELKELQDSLQSLDKFQQYGLKVQTGAGGKPVAVNAEATPKTAAQILEKGKVADTKADDYDYEQWKKAVFGTEKAKGGISNPLNVLTKAVKENTNTEASGLNFSDDWKGKSRLSFARETMTRNFEDVMGKDAPMMKEKYLEPIGKSEADRIRWLNKERGEIEALGIKPRSLESALLQDFGEGIINEVELRTKTNDPMKIIKAAEYLRNKYDGYIKQLNKVLVRNGYDPVPFRKDYFHHFNDLTLNMEVLGPWNRIGQALKAEELPTDINGITADFKPGRQFFNAILQRKGESHTPDAIQGIDKYLEGASNQIFHTDNIKRLRSLESEIRGKYAGDTHLTNFAADLQEFTNNLAGKKAMFDRGFESWFGRPVYTVLNAIKSQVGANMVGGNIASALTNYIPLTQTLATTNKLAVARAMADTVKNVANDDGFVEASDFLTRRIGSDKLTKTWWESAGQKAGWLFEMVDKFTSQVVVRSKYLEGIDKGLSPQEAMKSANDWAARIMADRSKGATPTMFNSKSMGALTQFQLEVNNQLSFLFKDIPRNAETWKKAGSQIAQLFIYGYIFNNLTEWMFGRRPALDPIGVAEQAYEDFTNPNMKEGKAVKNLVNNVANQLPFVSTFTGGRIPISSAIPNPMKVVNGESTTGKELKKLTYLLPPFGGGQAIKTYEGLKSYIQGYSSTPKGEVRFPVEKNTGNLVRSGLFGQWSTPEAVKYLREGQTPMGDNQSELIKQTDDKIGLFNKIKKASAAGYDDDKIREQVKKDGSAQFTDTKLFWYNEEADETRSINFGKYLQSPPTDKVQKARWEGEKFKTAMDVYQAEGVDEQRKAEVLTTLNVNQADLAYYDIASDDVNIKRIFVGEYLSSLDPDTNKLAALAELRRTVRSQAILSDNVISAMVKYGELTEQEGKLLKKIDWDEQKNEPLIQKSGSKKIKIKSVRLESSSATPTVSRMPTVQIKMATGSRIPLETPQLSSRRTIKLKKLPTAKLKIKPTYYQGLQK